MMISNGLIMEIAGGDEDALRVLHHALHGSLFYYAYTLTSDRDASQEAVQEAFVRLWHQRATFNNAMAVKVYLYYVVRNVVRNHLRAQRRMVSIPEHAAAQEDLAMVSAETCGMVRAAVEALPPQTRRVIELSMAELTVVEIAEQMDISPNSVKTLKKAGYSALRQKLGGLHSLLHLLLPL